MVYPIFGVMYKDTMLAVKCIYACYQMYLCLLSNASMLAIKCIYACYQMYLCLLSKMFLIPVKDVFLLSKLNILC